MAGATGRLVDDLRGVSALAVDGVLGVIGVVEHLHATIANLSRPIGAATRAPARGLTGLVYRSVRGVARGVGVTLERTLSLLDTGAALDAPQREHVLAALNGVLGDRLAARGNPLAIAMQLRRDDVPLPSNPGFARAEPARPRVAIFLHGLCMHDGHWPRGAGSADEAMRALGYTVLYLRYNSGRRIADNGAELSTHLESVVRSWSVTDLALIGHSMGGLVARSAAEQARRGGAAWLSSLRHLVFLGTPHHGSALERAGKRVDRLLGVSPYSAPFATLGGARSAGIQDLGHGRVMPDTDHVPLPRGVRSHAVGGSLRLGSDGLVAVDSALGQRGLAFPKSRTLLIEGAGHLDLLRHPAWPAALTRWLRPRRAAAP